MSRSDPASELDVAAAVDALRRGEPLLVHDAEEREGEVDLIYHAADVTPDAVAHMRNDAGGLVCVALSPPAPHPRARRRRRRPRRL